ncbi:MAG: NTF2 fold immunity protein [Bacteroidia bacterium]
MTYRILLIAVILLTKVSCGQTFKGRTTLGVDYAKNELQNAITNTTENQILVDTIIKDKETAITISEAVLFKIYGKDNITKQRPYEVYSINGYWVLGGTLPEEILGGTFLIILNAKNGQVIKLTHGK